MQPTINNPFIHRERISEPDALFDRERILKNLRAYLERGMHCQIVGPFGVGKSSLLYNLKTFAKEWDKTRLQNGRNESAVAEQQKPNFWQKLSGSSKREKNLPHLTLDCAYIDLQEPQCQTARGFTETVWKAWEVGPPPASLLEFSERMEDWHIQKRRPVLCLDNFEAFLKQPKEFGAYFFYDLRGLAKQGLIFATTSEKSLSHLMPPHYPSSPFFNIFAVQYLGPFRKEEAEDFVNLNRPGVPPFTPDEKAAILSFAKGHPLALQVVCFHVLEAKWKGEPLAVALQSAEVEMGERMKK
jgi:energy-coupling factor transporter ATP-binding protein EcfA2